MHEMWWYLIFHLLGAQNEDINDVALAIHIPTTAEVTSVAVACNKFALDVHNQLISSDNNVFFSPYSICAIFSMVLLGAEGNTAKEIRDTFHYDENQDINVVYKKLISEYNQPNSTKWTLKTASKIFGAKYFEVKSLYQKQMQQYFRAKLEQVDFGGDEAEETINQWVAEQTNDKITELFDKGSLGSDTVAVLANAIYFKGSWKNSFSKRQTKKKKFKLMNGEKILVDMMRMETYFPYTEDIELNAKILHLPYSGNRLKMLIILPIREFGLADVMKKLTADKLLKLMDAPTVEVLVQFPKFKLSTKMELTSILHKLQLNELFNNRANLSGISNYQLQISEVKHKAFVQVDEEGTEAAAVTGMSVSRSLSFPSEFICDHPFYFAIVDNVYKFILFSGTILEPKNE